MTMAHLTLNKNPNKLATAKLYAFNAKVLMRMWVEMPHAIR